jgi:hypothetical protein
MSDVTPEERIRAATAGVPVGGPRVDPLPDPDRTYVTIKQAQQLTGAARRTVMGWLAEGRVQRFKAPNGYGVLIDKLELESFDRTRRGGAPVVIDGKPHWD